MRANAIVFFGPVTLETQQLEISFRPSFESQPQIQAGYPLSVSDFCRESACVHRCFCGRWSGMQFLSPRNKHIFPRIALRLQSSTGGDIESVGLDRQPISACVEDSCDRNACKRCTVNASWCSSFAVAVPNEPVFGDASGFYGSSSVDSVSRTWDYSICLSCHNCSMVLGIIQSTTVFCSL